MSLSGGEKAHRLQKALDCGGHATHRMDDVVRMLKAGEATLFENEGGVIIAEIQSVPATEDGELLVDRGRIARDCLALGARTSTAWADRAVAALAGNRRRSSGVGTGRCQDRLEAVVTAIL